MPSGGVYGEYVNKMYDDLRAPGGNQTFSVLGVQKGDIVIVDPVGTIPQIGGLPIVPEKGARPIGDWGVPGRVDAGGASVHTPGRPNPLDDNRGFYRVKQVVDAQEPYLKVDPITGYSGEDDQPVVFGVTPDNKRAYAVYPTIEDSLLKQPPYAPPPPPGPYTEGQMDLRPTALRDPVTKSFDHPPSVPPVGHSIRPFSYRIIRPSKLFSNETIDMVLMVRERMLSLIEFLRRVISGLKSGTYFIFQRDVHIEDLGFAIDPETGLGVLSDLYITSLAGRINVVPFSNTESCLSLLDRRFWILDLRLDQLTKDPVNPVKMKKRVGAEVAYTTYTDPSSGEGGAVRPVLPDRIEEALNSRDRFRPIRYVWLAYRTHKILGTLAAIRRYDQELPERLEEQRRLLLLEFSAKAMEGVAE
jgi:hypothetical protein